MHSECANCDRQAMAYHGPYAYCSKCLEAARMAWPDLHRCQQCGVEQPANVSWHRNKPCGACQRVKA